MKKWVQTLAVVGVVLISLGLVLFAPRGDALEKMDEFGEDLLKLSYPEINKQCRGQMHVESEFAYRCYASPDKLVLFQYKKDEKDPMEFTQGKVLK